MVDLGLAADLARAQAEALQPTALPRKEERPDPEWVRGKCPLCGEECVSNIWWVGGKGYVIKIHCWGALGLEEEKTCSYEQTL